MESEPIRRGGMMSRAVKTLFGTIVGALAGTGVLFFVVLQLHRVFEPFFTSIAWAIIFGLGFSPLHGVVQRIVRGRATCAALITTMLVVCTVVIPVVALSGMLMKEGLGAAEQIREFAWSGGFERLVEQVQIAIWIPLTPLWEFVSPWVGLLAVDLKGLAPRVTAAAADFLVEQIKDAAAGFVIVLVKFGLMLFTLFFVFRDGQNCYYWVKSLVPFSPEEVDTVFLRLGDTIRGVIYGIGGAAVGQGILAGVMYWILGLPAPALWALLTAASAPIPIGGTAIVWVPASIYLMVAESVWRGLTLLIFGAAVVSMLDNIIKTYVIGGKTQLPTLLLLFAIIGGLKVYGLLGLFLGPLLLALAMTGIALYRERKQKGPAVSTSVTVVSPS